MKKIIIALISLCIVNTSNSFLDEIGIGVGNAFEDLHITSEENQPGRNHPAEFIAQENEDETSQLGTHNVVQPRARYYYTAANARYKKSPYQPDRAAHYVNYTNYPVQKSARSPHRRYQNIGSAKNYTQPTYTKVRTYSTYQR